ncbi:MAG TPA: RusA family crossover junction endodeoxyribonuclease [Candidatus Methanofastidiosum sp.]|nr:RusA family crossover junction endodeoxyribonuclease [Methanofastidiosum sp.]
MKTVFFIVFGDPKGKARPRITTINNHARSFQTAKQNAVENYIKMAYLETADGIYFNGALAVRITAYFPIPKSASKKKRDEMLSGIIRPVIKPDCDNILKCVEDSLNKIAYDDDKQIVDSHILKYYSDRPRTVIEIKELKND